MKTLNTHFLLALEGSARIGYKLKSKPMFLCLVFISILFSACNPNVLKRQVTGKEGLEILVTKTPILNTFQVFEPCANLDQTIGDVTLQVEKMFVSQRTIAIGLVTSTQSGKQFEPVKISLSYPSGAPLKWSFGTGVYGSSDDLGITLPSTERIDLIFFEENNSPKIGLPLDADLKISFTEMKTKNEVGPFQFPISLGKCATNTK